MPVSRVSSQEAVSSTKYQVKLRLYSKINMLGSSPCTILQLHYSTFRHVQREGGELFLVMHRMAYGLLIQSFNGQPQAYLARDGCRVNGHSRQE